MILLENIFKKIKKTKEKRIEKLVLKLVEEMEPFYDDNKEVNYIDIYYDFFHHEERKIHVNCNFGKFEAIFNTNKPNKNFKK